MSDAPPLGPQYFSFPENAAHAPGAYSHPAVICAWANSTYLSDNSETQDLHSEAQLYGMIPNALALESDISFPRPPVMTFLPKDSILLEPVVFVKRNARPTGSQQGPFGHDSMNVPAAGSQRSVPPVSRVAGGSIDVAAAAAKERSSGRKPKSSKKVSDSERFYCPNVDCKSQRHSRGSAAGQGGFARMGDLRSHLRKQPKDSDCYEIAKEAGVVF